MKKYKMSVFALAITLIFVGVVVYMYYAYSTIDIKSLNMSVNISDSGKLGIILDSDAVYFGTTYLGGIQKRWINLENNYDFPITVSIRHEGNIAPMVYVSMNDFVMEPGGRETIIYYCDTSDFSEGVYEGTTTVVFKRSLFK